MNPKNMLSIIQGTLALEREQCPCCDNQNSDHHNNADYVGTVLAAFAFLCAAGFILLVIILLRCVRRAVFDGQQ